MWTKIRICLRWWRAWVWAVPLTKGFADRETLLGHYRKHKADFGEPKAEVYELLADHFLGGSLRPGVLQCQRRRGDVIRFDPNTDEFGIVTSSGIILTYFKPVPCVTISRTSKIRCHKEPTNLVYFQKECRK